jgi:tetratricopeptide (TPR) repeat protein
MATVNEGHRMKSAAVGFFLLILTGFVGCSSSKEAAPAAGSPHRSATEEMAHDLALQHFVDGSLYEMKGEYAQAVLEYQDALRYEKNDAIFFAIAKCYSQLGKHALAIEAAKEAVRLAPDKSDYRRTLADVYLAAFEIDSAAAQYEALLQHDSNSVDVWYSLARLYQARRPLKALEVYEKIIDRFGPQWDVLLQMAELYNTLGKFDKAAAALQSMLTIDPSNVELKRNLAQAYMRAEKYDDAYTVFSELRELDPNNIEYIGDVATIHLLKKDYAKASELFEVILTRDSVGVDTKLRVGEMYFGQLQKDSTLVPVALSVFERIRGKHPDDWRCYWFLGAIGAVARIDSIAIPNLKRVTELASWNADGWVYLASVLMEKNKYSDVASLLEAALKILPDDFQVNFYLGVAYSRLNKNIDAARVLEHAHELNAKDINAVSQLALVYDGMKKYEESDKLYEEALKLDPQNATLLNNYGYSLADRGIQLQRALDMAKKAVDAQPDNPSFLDTIGWVYYRLGRFKEAETYVERAIKKGEVSPVVYEHLGDIYFRLNDKEKAKEEWDRALKLDQSNTALREKIARGTL